MGRLLRGAPVPRSWVKALLAVLAGCMQAWALALPGWGQPSGLLQITGVALLYALLRPAGAAPWHAAGIGWLAALSALVATFWWLFISMHTYGGLAAPLAVAAVLALAGFLALYYALAAGLWARWHPRGVGPGAAWGRMALFALLWLGAELLRGTLWTGFPWGAAGYAQIDNALLRPFVPWLGVYGVGALAALLGAGLCEGVWMLRQRRVRPLAGLLLPVLLLGALGPVLQAGQQLLPADWRGRDHGTLTVALLQGNIPQDEKFVVGAGIEKSLIWYGQQLWASRAELTLAPETAIPLLPEQLPPGYWSELTTAIRSGDRAALIGAPLGNLEQGYTNSVVGIVPGSTADQDYRYDKHHLVPFGEFIPPLFRWFTDLMNIPLGDFNRGPLGQASFVWRDQRLAPNICYEDLFGEEIARTFVDVGRAPTVLANVGNIGWFGDTVAVDQHLQISRMRALEFDRPMLRATNTGATAIIDHQARVQQLARPFTETVLTGQVTGRDGLTPYAYWVARAGFWPFWLLLLLGLAWAVCARRRAVA